MTKEEKENPIALAVISIYAYEYILLSPVENPAVTIPLKEVFMISGKIGIVGVLLFFLLLVNGLEQSHAEVKLSMWFHSGRAEERVAIAAVIDNFSRQNNGITVEMVQLPEGSYNDQVQAAALAGDLPDVLDFDGPNVYNYAWSGYLLPLDNYISREMREDFLPSILDQATFNDTIYNLGSFDSGLALWGNRDYLKKAGVRIPTGVEDSWTQEEFLTVLDKLKALPEVEYPIDFKMNYGVGEWFTYGFSPILQSFGGDLIDRRDFQHATGIINGPEAVQAMTFFQSLFQEGYARASQAGDNDFYGKQTAALSYAGHWVWQSYHKALGEKLVLLPMPVFGKKSRNRHGFLDLGHHNELQTQAGGLGTGVASCVDKIYLRDNCSQRSGTGKKKRDCTISAVCRKRPFTSLC